MTAVRYGRGCWGPLQYGVGRLPVPTLKDPRVFSLKTGVTIIFFSLVSLQTLISEVGLLGYWWLWGVDATASLQQGLT